jgi:sulfate adenylyltransferase subunit 2
MQTASEERGVNPIFLGLDVCRVWDMEQAFKHLSDIGQANTKRSAERLLNALGMLPPELTADDLADEQGRTPIRLVLNQQLSTARSKRKLVMFAQLYDLPGGRVCLNANDARGARYWIPLDRAIITATQIEQTLSQLHAFIDKEVAIFPHGRLVAMCRVAKTLPGVSLLAYPSAIDFNQQVGTSKVPRGTTVHLKRLEDESIHILREAVAEAQNPVMLYSVGKDSSVMLQLARKAFYPAPPPFPLLHVDTRWKFQEMYQFRDQIARTSGMEVLVHINPEAVAKNINPFDHGSNLHTAITKTEGLKQALDHHKFDVIFGGARRDEEKSRAKERIFSFRTTTHHWDPKNQRPELWNLYNTRKNPGESIRVFPLSNWTELDIWHYIYQENIPVVPLYFAKERPVVVRDGMIMLVDDDRCQLLPGEEIQRRQVRFRTLGCYPLTGAVDSTAETLEEIVLELVNARSSERQGRKIDSDTAASMEKKKQEGYF